MQKRNQSSEAFLLIVICGDMQVHATVMCPEGLPNTPYPNVPCSLNECLVCRARVLDAGPPFGEECCCAKSQEVSSTDRCIARTLPSVATEFLVTSTWFVYLPVMQLLEFRDFAW
jgi:hypothetical protein